MTLLSEVAPLLSVTVATICVCALIRRRVQMGANESTSVQVNVPPFQQKRQSPQRRQQQRQTARWVHQLARANFHSILININPSWARHHDLDAAHSSSLPNMEHKCFTLFTVGRLEYQQCREQNEFPDERRMHVLQSTDRTPTHP